MLTLARADADHGNKALESLNLAAVVEAACEMARSIAEDRHLDLSVSLAPSHLVNVRGDFTTLRRLFWILLYNALKYTQAPERIDVALSANNHQATVEVRDSGVGISAANLPHIFERFFRADPSRSNTDGAGLGLAIAKWIAEMHHADLTVASEMQKGTAFQLVIPICANPGPIA
jgi:signal transduction histidine kinase